MRKKPTIVPIKQLLLLLLVTTASLAGRAQQVDSIFFNLYTDSLKKGVHNYINVDGKLSNGRWLPLTNKEIDFTASTGKFVGNSLVIDTAFKGEKVTVKAVLKNNNSIWKEVTIYMKKVESTERLKTVDEILNTPSRRSRKSSRNFAYRT
ncbi:hypothetical protein FAM09_27065 [Niastella caeni]|uniref:Uncharacterized protein n=1 Tax=Niastella caeni TaxID=2569763 RepID=A0A4V4GZF4_9BACT|nr:hypothetical protein [Niastella caeni]THU32456.1 hypothetical protein FAM09_27065 [Niastella caeni]